MGEQFGSGSEAIKPREPRFVSVGQVVRPHGIRGEVRMDIPRRTALPPLDDVTHVAIGESGVRRGLRSFRFHRGGLLLKLEGCEDRAAAEALRGQRVSIPMQKQETLKAGEYYVDDLLGLSVCDEQGEYLGQLVEVLPTGANDVYRVVHDDEEVLLPAITNVIRTVDLSRGRMVIRLLPGLRV